MMYIVTVQLPQTEAQKAVRECRHSNNHIKRRNGHCSYMTCANYSERCPLHAIAQTGETCNMAKKTGACPGGLAGDVTHGATICTDIEGGQHSFIRLAPTIVECREKVQENLPKGAEIIRIEEA